MSCYCIGDSVQLSRDRVGVVRYIGCIAQKRGIFYGIELIRSPPINSDRIIKNEAFVKGICYFNMNVGNEAVFVRAHQIQYLVKRHQKNGKIKVVWNNKKKSKVCKRNYIKKMRKKLANSSDNNTTNECINNTMSLSKDIPRDVIVHHMAPYFYSFEKYVICGVCSEFNDIFSFENKISIVNHSNSDIKYWIDHNLSKYYKISPNFFTHLDLRNNRLLYLTKQERKALKYFLIHHKDIHSLLNFEYSEKDDESKSESEENNKNISKNNKKLHDFWITRTENMVEMTRMSFCGCSVQYCDKNIAWICDVLQYMQKPKPNPTTNVNSLLQLNMNCLKILDLNFSGINDQCLLSLTNALCSRKKGEPLMQLEYILLLNNIGISDKYIESFFNAIGSTCLNLKHVNLRRCNLSDVSCSVILNFYLKNYENTKIRHVDLELNAKITKKGNEKINKIFQIHHKLAKDLIIHYGHNKKSYCWECRTLYDQ